MPRCEKRLEQQSIDGFIRVIERGEVDFLIPPGKQLEVRDQPVRQVLRKKQVGLRGPFGETGAQIPWRHP